MKINLRQFKPSLENIKKQYVLGNSYTDQCDCCVKCARRNGEYCGDLENAQCNYGLMCVNKICVPGKLTLIKKL